MPPALNGFKSEPFLQDCHSNLFSLFCSWAKTSLHYLSYTRSLKCNLYSRLCSKLSKYERTNTFPSKSLCVALTG